MTRFLPRQLLPLTLALLALAAPVWLRAAEVEPGTRLADAQVAAFRRQFDDVQVRLQKLEGASPYHVAKAAHWLFFASTALSDDDRGPIVPAALGEATNLLLRLEAGRTDLPHDAAGIAFVAPIRPDLWQLVGELKQQANFATGQVAVARLEVQLVWAAYAYKRVGWRAAKPVLEKAEEFAAAAQAAMQYRPATARVQPTPGAPATAGVLNLDTLQAALRELNAAGVPVRSYAFAKAQHWLDFARAEDDARNRSGIVTEAARQSALIIQQIQAGDPKAGLETPMFKNEKKVREDLWQLAAEMKKHPSFAAAADRVAQLEVQLVRAAHENAQLGWRSARPHIAAAERMARDAQSRLGLIAQAGTEANR